MQREIRQIIEIDEDKCDGCGLCIPACAEGALQIIEGKARLVKEIYCDGLGACLGECPQGAIEIVEREADPFDEEAVEEHLKEMNEPKVQQDLNECGVCCGSAVIEDFKPAEGKRELDSDKRNSECEPEAELSHWPVQLHLVSPQSRFLQGTDLLIAADCVPFAHADFHRKFLAGRSLLIGCPKLDDVDAYHQKLVRIFRENSLESITLVHMEVGCCFGLSKLVKLALKESGAEIPLEEVIIGIDGSIKSE
jgi:ferredoxin